MVTAIGLGAGILTWSPSERRTDRYGTVWLMNDGHTSESEGDPDNLLDEAAINTAASRTGRLVAKVVESRQSTHIGDLFHGFFPSIPDRGEIIELGEGVAFVEVDSYAGNMIGLKPEDDRAGFWLDPRALYRAHEQLVELRFLPN